MFRMGRYEGTFTSIGGKTIAKYQRTKCKVQIIPIFEGKNLGLFEETVLLLEHIILNSMNSSHLDSLRQQIDSVDSEIINLLENRQSIVYSIAKHKQQENISIEQPERFSHMIQTRKNQAEKKELSPEFIEKLFTLIHEESVSFQEKQE